MLKEYEEVCEKEARFRINTQFPNLAKEKKEKVIKEMKNRLLNMYDDIFEANLMNQIAQLTYQQAKDL